MMNSIKIFQQALKFEKKIRDLYFQAERDIDDERGKAIFRALGRDEQSHMDFLHYAIEQLQENKTIDTGRLQSPIPAASALADRVDQFATTIPDKLLGNIKSVLSSALLLEKETSAHYRQACSETEGEIQRLFEKFLEIEERHVEMVSMELTHAMDNGVWFDFMEVSLEIE